MRGWCCEFFAQCLLLPGYMGQPLEACLQEFLFFWTIGPRLMVYLRRRDWVSRAFLNQTDVIKPGRPSHPGSDAFAPLSACFA